MLCIIHFQGLKKFPGGKSHQILHKNLSVFYCYVIIKTFSPGSSLNLYMKININNEYVYNSSSQKFCNQNQCHYHKFLHFNIFYLFIVTITLVSLISSLNNCSIAWGNTSSIHWISPLRYQPLSF